MAFDAVQMPPKISYGYVGGPGFATEITEVVAGHEERVQRWQEARWEWRVSKNLQTGALIHDMVKFFLARRGAARGFLFKDWADYATTVDGRTAASEGSVDPAFNDQAIGIGDGTTTQFQIRKQYVSGASIYVRSITRPIQTSTLSGIAGVEKSRGVDFTVSSGNGIVTYSTAPAIGAVVTVGCEFDVPVRFGVEIDEGLGARIEAFDVESIRDIPLIELKDEVEAPEDFSPGGSFSNLSMSASLTLSLFTGRFIRVDPQSSGLSIYLPNPFYFPGGGPYFHIYNLSATETVTLRTHEGVSLMLIDPTQFVVVFLEDNFSNYKAWYAVETG